MATTTTPTAEDLRERLVGHRLELAAAQSEIGVAELKGGPRATAAAKRLRAAHENVERVELALQAFADHEREATKHEREVNATAQRAHTYRWMVMFMDRSSEVVRLQRELAAAETHLRGLGPNRRIEQIENGRVLLDETDLDRELVGAMRSRFPHPSRPVDLGLTEEQCQRLRERAEALAAEDERQLAELRGGANGGTS